MASVLNNNTQIFHTSGLAPILGLAVQLATSNPILALYQLSREIDAFYSNGQFKEKVGDGVTPYNDLPYTILENKEISFTGAVDGVNTVFVCSHIPLIVTADGVFLINTIGYNIVGFTVTLVSPPTIGVVFYGNY